MVALEEARKTSRDPTWKEQQGRDCHMYMYVDLFDHETLITPHLSQPHFFTHNTSFIDMMTSSSWAGVAALPGQSKKGQPLEYSIRMTSAKRGASTIIKRAGPACNGQHCPSIKGHCALKACEDRLRHQMKQTETSIASLANGFDESLKTLERLKMDIFATCMTDKFTSMEMEASRLEVTGAMRAKVEPAFCKCHSCTYFAANGELDAWQVKATAVELSLIHI